MGGPHIVDFVARCSSAIKHGASFFSLVPCTRGVALLGQQEDGKDGDRSCIVDLSSVIMSVLKRKRAVAEPQRQRALRVIKPWRFDLVQLGRRVLCCAVISSAHRTSEFLRCL